MVSGWVASLLQSCQRMNCLMGCYQFAGTSECFLLVSLFDKCAPDFKMRCDKWIKNKSMKRFSIEGWRPSSPSSVVRAERCDTNVNIMFMFKNCPNPLLQDSWCSLTYTRSSMGSTSELSSALGCNFGVPQGSILGPLIFYLYINIFPEACRGGVIQMYAHDTIIVRVTDRIKGNSSDVQGILVILSFFVRNILLYLLCI